SEPMRSPRARWWQRRRCSPRPRSLRRSPVTSPGRGPTGCASSATCGELRTLGCARYACACTGTRQAAPASSWSWCVARPRERGGALLAAVRALAGMSALAVGLAHTTVVDQHLTTNALAALQADALARSGVAIAAVVVGETGAAGAPDTLGSPWARDAGR